MSHRPNDYGSPSDESWATASPDIPLLSREEHQLDVAEASEQLLPRWAKVDSRRTTERRFLTRCRLTGLVGLALAVGCALILIVDDRVKSTLSSNLNDWTAELATLGASLGTNASLAIAEPIAATNQTSTQQQIPARHESLTQLWLLNQTLNGGVVPFSPSDYAAQLAATQLEVPSTVLRPAACADEWIATGSVCSQLERAWASEEAKPKLDLVWTWVNGSSDEPLTGWRKQISDEFGFRRCVRRAWHVAKRAFGGDVARHFRDHNELKYSIRSASNSFDPSSIRTLHILVGDAPAGDVLPTTSITPSALRLAQVPHWLNLSKLRFSRPSQDAQSAQPSSDEPQLQIVPHSSIFKSAASTEREALEWRTSQVPSFNSLAIESQTANIPDLGEGFVGLNDDFFIRGNMSASDMFSPLSGVVLRFQRDLQVNALDPGRMPDGDSEWRGLGWANSLLDSRFGVRSRPYLVHQAKGGSGPLFREMHRLFEEELTKTAQARFRGKGAIEAQTWFLFTHFVIEKHREALLWSFLVARADANYDGIYSPDERFKLLHEIGFVTGDASVVVPTPQRESLPNLASSLNKAGLDLPRSTNLVFSSADGFAHFRSEAQISTNQWRPWPAFDQPVEDASSLPVCEINIDECFGEIFTKDDSLSAGGWLNVQATFKRLAFEKPRCGDCLIVALVGKSGPTGLNAFLPAPPPINTNASAVPKAVVVGLTPQWAEADFGLKLTPLTARATAVQLISRYTYTVGETPSAFLSNRGSINSLKVELERAEQDGAVMIAINDDISSYLNEYNVKVTDTFLGDWFETQWPNATRWEL